MKKNGLRDIELVYDLKEAIAGATIDKEKNIIHDVVILTGEKTSHNKTFYTKKALNEAVTRYDGAKMYLDHGDSPVRSVRDFGGTYQNLRLEENKLKADLRVTTNPSIRDIVFPLAEAKAGGLSMRDRGKGREEDGIFLVEGFASKGPFSIDLVTEPSVNKNLFESDQNIEDEEGGDMKLSEVTKEKLLEENKELVESIQKDGHDLAYKEVEEKIKKGEGADKILLLANKKMKLSDAGLPKEISEKTMKLIETDGISLEVAEGIIDNQKSIIEQFTKKPKDKDPEVKGNGKDKNIKENQDEIADEDYVGALS